MRRPHVYMCLRLSRKRAEGESGVRSTHGEAREDLRRKPARRTSAFSEEFQKEEPGENKEIKRLEIDSAIMKN
jgi:hypothetical protein